MRAVERIQRSATRYITNYSSLSYQERCTSLNMLPLCFRREISDLMFLFKCMRGIYNIPLHNYVSFVSSESSLRSANRGCTLVIPRVRTETFMSSYFNRIVHMWNCLPIDSRKCTNVNSFKKSIVKHYTSKLGGFNVDVLCTWSSICRCNSCVCNRAR